MNLTLSVNDDYLMNTDEVMERIAKWQGWRITRHPDRTDFVYEVQNERGFVFTYDLVNDEIEYADGTTKSLFDNNNGGNDDCYSSLAEFLDVPSCVWGTDDDDEYFLYCF